MSKKKKSNRCEAVEINAFNCSHLNNDGRELSRRKRERKQIVGEVIKAMKLKKEDWEDERAGRMEEKERMKNGLLLLPLCCCG